MKHGKSARLFLFKCQTQEFQVKCGIFVALAFLSCVLGSVAWSQTGTSRITGTVEDSTGAGLSAAKVVVINEGTSVSNTTTSNAAGGYGFESMAPGAYTIRIEAPGFKTFVSTGNVLTIGQPMTLNAKLSVGAVNERMEVVASAETVQTSTSGNFGNLVDLVAVANLPIVDAKGRNPLDLVNFQPGVVVGANTGGGIHVHGARDRAWNYTLDGVDANETSAPGGGSSPIRPNPDMLAEFRVVTGNATADIGRASGGDVAMVTRSGTNSFHGNVFYFYQTPSFNANEVTNKISTPPLPRNQFVQHIGGFSLGGPIQKGKTFFFGNFQFLRTTQTAKVHRYVYTAQARQGLFRYVHARDLYPILDNCPQKPAGQYSGRFRRSARECSARRERRNVRYCRQRSQQPRARLPDAGVSLTRRHCPTTSGRRRFELCRFRLDSDREGRPKELFDQARSHFQ